MIICVYIFLFLEDLKLYTSIFNSKYTEIFVHETYIPALNPSASKSPTIKLGSF